MTPSFIKITQALWLLDHQDFMEAIDMLLDPLVSMNDLKPWQHQCIIRAFLYQGQHQMSLKYVRVQQPPLKDIEDIRLNLTVLLVNGLIHEAFQYQRQHSNEQNSKDLLQHFFNACQQMNQLSVVLQLALSPAEEEAFSQFLQSCQNPRADDMRVMYYLERSRIAEAMEVNDSIRSLKGHIEMSCLKRSRSEDKPICVRDTIVQAYANTLPSVTRKLAQYCAQEKLKAFTWKQVTRPTPMSVAVHRGESQPVRYRSSLIQATLEKARETWNHLSSPCTPGKRDRSSMEKPSVEMTPFLCTPRAASQTPGIQRDITDVVFPTLTYPSPKTDDEVMGGSPVKRFRYSEHYPTSLGSTTPSQRKRLDRYSSVDAQSLLQTPHVRRRTLSMSRQEQNDTNVFTPQSILKVRKLVRRSVSPDNMSLPSFTSSSTTPDLPAGEDEQADKQMQVSDEEFPIGRQIRFSFPMVQEDREKSKTPDVEEPIGAVTRSAIKRSLLGGTPRRALSRTRRSPGVRFGTTTTEKRVESNTSISWIIRDKPTVETESNVEENESSSVENDSDAFHSLENSGSVESPMKKQRTDSPRSNTEEQTVECVVDNRSVESTIQDDDDMDTSSKKTDSLLPKETVQQEKLLDKNFMEDNADELAASNKTRDVSDGNVPLTGNLSDTSYEDKKGAEAVPANDKGENSNADESLMDLEEERKGILVEDMTYDGSSFEVSYEDEAQEISANDKEQQDENSNADEELMNHTEERKGILLEDTTYQGSSFEVSYDDEAQEISANDKEQQDENSNADEELMNHTEERKGILVEDTTYHGSSFEVSYESEANETEEKERSEGEEVVVETCKLQEQPTGIEENNAEEVELQELTEDGLLLSQEVTSSNGEEQAYADYCNGVYEVEEPDALPSLIAESVTGNIKQDGEYQTLQSAAVLISDEESDMEMIPTLPDVLRTGDKYSEDEEEIEDGEEEELSPCARWKSHSDDEASIVVLDSDSEDAQAEAATMQLRYNEESDELDDEIEEEEEEEEIESEYEVEHKSDDDSSIEAPGASYIKRKVSDSTSDDGETGQVGNTSSEESEQEYKTKVENVTTDDGNVNKNVIIEEFDSSEDSQHRVREYITFEEHVSSGSQDETTVQNVKIEEPDTSGEAPCVSQEIVSIEEVCEECKIVQTKTSSTVDKASVEDKETCETELNDELKSKKDELESSKRRPDDDSKEKMDFEDCISFNEISKSGYNKVPQVMGVDKDEAMDFEVEIVASQISKPKICEPDVVCTETMEVQVIADKSNDTNSSGKYKAQDSTLTPKSERRKSRSRSGSVPPENTGPNKLGKTVRAPSAPPEDISYSNQIKSEEQNTEVDLNSGQRSDFKTENLLQVIEEEPCAADKNEAEASVRKRAQTRGGSLPPSSSHINKIHKSRRSSSVEPEDNINRPTDISVKHPRRKICKPENEAAKDTETGVHKPESVVLEDIYVKVTVEKTQKAENRTMSVPPDDIPATVVDKKPQKATGRSRSVPPEDVPGKKPNKAGIRAGSVPRDSVSVMGTDKKTRKTGSLAPEDDDPAVYVEIKTGSVPPEDLELRKSGKRSGSVPPEDVPVVDVENKFCKAGSRSGSIPEDGVPAVDTEMETGSVPPEDLPVVDKKLQKSGKRSGSVPPETLPVVEKLQKSGKRSGSVPPEALPVVDKKLQKSGKRSSSVPPEALPVVDVENKFCKARSRSESIPEDDVPAVDTEMETVSVQPEAVPVVDLEKKTKKTRSRCGSIPPEDATGKEPQKSALVEENVCVDRPSTVCNEDADIVVTDRERRASVSSQASTVHLKPNRNRRSSISSQASSAQEDMRLDIVYEEPEDDVGSVVKNRRLSGDFDLSARRTRSESGSFHSIQTRRSTRRAASAMEGNVIRTLQSGKVISESEDDVGQAVKADSTSGGDSINSQQVIEEYATARRLTRHQRSLLERSLELAKTSSQSSRSYRLPTLPETSDDECETSSVGTRSSSRISARHAHATENSSPNTSQASTVHILGSESSPAKTPRRSRRSLSRLNDSFMDSPSSVKSDASTVYASSVTSLASPTSTRSEDVTGSRMRRRSFQKAQEVFRSVSERSYPIRSKVSSPTNSDVSSESSSGILTRSAVVRLSQLREEDLGSPSSFQFSPPTVVPGAGKKEAPSSPVPAFVFSPPQKQQPHPKPHRSQVTSQKIRAHTMALRGLHTITEGVSTSSPSTSLSTGQLQSSERVATPIAVKRSKRFKSTPKTARPRISIMTPLTEEEKRELTQRQQSGRRSTQHAETRRYSAFKQRKSMKLLKSRSSKSPP